MDFESEIYTYLGSADSTYFFIHLIYKETFDDSISHEIYNVLMHEEIITCKDENVIIYEMNILKNSINVICIQNESKGNSIKIFKENLENFFKVCLKEKRNDLLCIKYDYNENVYVTLVLENMNFNELFSKDFSKESNSIHEITYVFSKKSF